MYIYNIKLTNEKFLKNADNSVVKGYLNEIDDSYFPLNSSDSNDEYSSEDTEKIVTIIEFESVTDSDCVEISYIID